MTYQPPQPPTINGVMDLTAEEQATIKLALQQIQTDFEPSEDAPICDVFYMVAAYNRQNDLKINGDTATSLLD